MTDATNVESGWVVCEHDAALAEFTSTDGKYVLIASLDVLGESKVGPILSISLYEKSDRDRIFCFDEIQGDAARQALQSPRSRNTLRNSDQTSEPVAQDVILDRYPTEPTEGMREFLKAHPQVFDGLAGLKGFENISPDAIADANALVHNLLSPGRGIED